MKYKFTIMLLFLFCLPSCFQEEDFAPLYDTNPNDMLASIASSKALYLKEKELLEVFLKRKGKMGNYEILVCDFDEKYDLIFVSKKWRLKTTHYTDKNIFRFSIIGEGKIYAFKSTGIIYKKTDSDNFHFSDSFFTIDNGVISNKNVGAELFRDIYEMDDALLTRIKNKLKNNLSYENLIGIM